MLMLKELKKMVKPVEKNGKMPTAKSLKESGVEVVVKEKIDCDTEISVYANGYVLYQVANRYTVFPLMECGVYEYEMPAGETKVYDASFFDNENWYVRLIMEGEDRMERNQEKIKTNHKVLSYDRLIEDCGELLGSKEDLQEWVIQNALIHDLFTYLNDRQREAVYLFYIEEWKQKDISEYFGVSQQSVSEMIKRAVKILAKAFKEEK